MTSRDTFLRVAGLLMVGVLLASPAAFAAGSHDNECIECHSIHDARGEAIIAVDPFNPDNPSTGAVISDVSSLCMGCHNEMGDASEIKLMNSHPVGLSPVKAAVPSGRLSEDGLLTCVSCHDPHPSNPNYAYLITDVVGGSEMGLFCAICHPLQRE